MLASLIRRRWPLALGAALLVIVALGAALLVARANSGVGGGGDDDAVVVYNGRSHYGDEDVFHDFERETGIDVVLRGGTAPELFERLRREGEDTPADLLVTTDLANLWRAEEAGLLQNVTTPALREHVPRRLHDPQGAWWALTTRLRIPVVSAERVPEDAVTDYDDLGDPRWKGRTCLRTSTS
jgi:iron(III) transport system substrate-binding protein